MTVLLLTPDLLAQEPAADPVPVFRSCRASAPERPEPIRPRPGAELAAEVRRLRRCGVPPRLARPELPPITETLANEVLAKADRLLGLRRQQ